MLYNFTGASGTISSHVGNVFNGTLLAPMYSFNLDGTFNGAIVVGGPNISLMSGAVVNTIPFTAVPEPSSLALLALGTLAGIVRVCGRRGIAARNCRRP